MYLILGVYILLCISYHGEGFPSMQRDYITFDYLFILLTAACFGRTTIFKQKHQTRKALPTATTHHNATKEHSPLQQQ
jgi:hypothetical protein